MKYCGQCGRTSRMVGRRFICKHCRPVIDRSTPVTSEMIQEAHSQADDAWRRAGATTPCYEPNYMEARAKLAELHERAGK